MSAPSSGALSLRLKTRSSCSLKTCGGIDEPSNASSPMQLGEFLSYFTAASVTLAIALSRSFSLNS